MDLNYLVSFRYSFHNCLTSRADALFGLTDAVLRKDGPVTTRGHRHPLAPQQQPGTPLRPLM
jgi:hypothetical protein